MASGLVSLDIRSLLPPDTAVIPADFYCGNTTLIRIDLSTLPISVIESDCFRYLHSLTELILSRHLVRIESGSFRGLVSIRLIDLSNCSMLRVLEENTFVGAHLLRTLILPDGLVEIGPGAFRELMSLENLTIPASVMTISPRAFNRCSRLKNVILRGQPNIDPNAFKGCHPSLTFVHQSSSELEARRLQLGQAAAGGSRMEVAVVEPSVHPDLLSLHQSSSEVEAHRLQSRQAAAGCGRMEVAVVKPPVHQDLPFCFPFKTGTYKTLKGELLFEQADEGFECQITYDTFVAEMKIVILPCGHAFSVTGMLQWYEVNRSCPSCNAKLQ
jgi:hypothetical protein